MPYTLLASLTKNGKGGSKEENVSELEKDLLLAFKEQDKLLLALALALSSPQLQRHFIKLSNSQIDGASTIKLKELRYSSPLLS